MGFAAQVGVGVGMNTVTMGVVNWGDVYWPRFGERWMNAVLSADPQPDRIMIATDKPIEGLSDRVTQIVYEGGFMGINLIAKECGTDWLFFSGLDDEVLPDAFAGIEGEEDAIAYGCQQAGQTTALAFAAGRDAYEVCWQLPYNPMNGGYIYRCSALCEIPYREYIYADEVLFAEWAYFGKRIKFDNRIRLIWHRWNGSVSWPANTAGEQQAQEFKARLRAGLIQKGVPE